MNTLDLVLLVLLVVGAVIVFLSWTAGRLDRMHIRLATAEASLDRHLADRAACADRVAAAAVVDPASALAVVEAVEAAYDARGDGERDATESTVSVVLRAVFDDPVATRSLVRDCDEGQRDLVADLAEACARTQLAHQFHCDLVTRTQRMRRRRLVRSARLAGHAPWPGRRELDVVPPAGLAIQRPPP